MLIQFKVKNYKSFKEEQTFSMVASSDKALQDQNVVETKGHESNLLLTAAIYGPNGSGKSTFVDALDTMQELVLTSTKSNTDGDELVEIIPFKLSRETLEQPTEFEIIFWHKETKYQYGFSSTSKRVYSEYLYAFPEARAQLWFQRVLEQKTLEDQWYFGPKLKGSKKPIQEATRTNALFLSTAAMLNHEQLKHPFEWFKENLRVLHSNNVAPNYTTKICKQEELKNKILKFMNGAQLEIKQIEIRERKPEHLAFPTEIPNDLKELFLSKAKEGELDQPIFVHKPSNSDKAFKLDLDELSLGTSKIFSLAGPILDVLDKGRVLVIDELHSNFHPFLTDYIIRQFRKATNHRHSQLIYTTHDTFMLNSSQIRRDQIWLTERDSSSLESSMFPITDFHPRKNENYAKGYLEGRYGAIPFIDHPTEG